MSARIPVSNVLLVLFAAVAVLSGCGVSAEENILVQDTQLKEAISQADGWGEEITAQIPVAEIEPESGAHNIGGVRKTSDYGAEWPEYYYWAQIVELYRDGYHLVVEVYAELCELARRYFGANGRCLAASPTDGEVQLLLYGVEVFYLRMPEPRMTTFTFAYEVSDKLRTFDYFGEWLSAQNTAEDLDRAFGVLDRFARLRLPDKYLDAWEASRSERE